MTQPISERELVERWRMGDESAINTLYERYCPRLMRVLARNVAICFSARLDADDIMQSIWKSIHCRLIGGEFEFQEDGAFWKLLVTVALNKVRNTTRFHRAMRRDPSRETSFNSAERFDAHLAVRLCQEPSPSEATEFADLLRHVLSRLDENEQQVIHLRMAGYNQEEIAAQLGVHERTVRRMSRRIQERCASLLGASEPARAD